MKKLIILMLLGLFVLPAIQSCKKGENDPALSLKSRKARFCGEWNLKEGFSKSTDSDGTIKTHTYNGVTVVITETGLPDVSSIRTQRLTVNKNGTYKLEVLYEDSETISEGAWYFGRANKDLDLKNKEIVHLVQSKYTYINGNSTITTGTETLEKISTWQLDKLSSKELVVIENGTVTTNTGSSSYTGTMTYEKK